MQYQVVAGEGAPRSVVDVALPGRPMVHDMGLTPTYAVIMDMPVSFSDAAAMNGESLP